jgi:hypothetical protein
LQRPAGADGLPRPVVGRLEGHAEGGGDGGGVGRCGKQREPVRRIHDYRGVRRGLRHAPRDRQADAARGERGGERQVDQLPVHPRPRTQFG